MLSPLAAALTEALLPLFDRYDIPVPENPWPSQVVVPDTLAQACAEGVQAEIKHSAMYERRNC